MKSPEFKIIFGLIIFAVSFGLPLLQFIMKKYKSAMETRGTAAPDHDSDELFWEDEVVDNGEDYEEDHGMYYQPEEMYQPEPPPPYHPDEFHKPEAVRPAVAATAAPEEESSYEGYAGFLRNNLRSSVVASEILGKPRGLQD